MKLNIVVTAGPTREYLDPVRFLSNESTGVMGFACAREAHRRGHRVILVKGTTVLEPPPQVKSISVVSARQMLKVLRQHWDWLDVLIMTAAVSDYRPERQWAQKISKKGHAVGQLKLILNPDILKSLAGSDRKKGRRCLVGFSLESDSGFERAREKLRVKNLDFIVCNWVTRRESPFGNRRVRAVLIPREGQQKDLGPIPKSKIAKAILDKVEQICYQLPEVKERGVGCPDRIGRVLHSLSY